MNKYETNIPFQVTEEGDKILSPFGPMIFQSYLDENFIKDLIEQGSHLTKKDDDWRHSLAGNMKSGGSYIYNDDFILKSEKYLLKYVERFFNAIIDRYGDDQIYALLDKQLDRRQKKVGKLRLDTMWINYQHKNDFNPPHNHRGALSFVIFCKVPKNIFDKQDVVSNSNTPGKIIFSYGEQTSALCRPSYQVFPDEGLIFIFPSKLTHSVPPFWADEERISVSGNFVVV